MTDYIVCCSGGSRAHGRIDFAPLTRKGDEIKERRTRNRPGPWGEGATITAEGESFPMAASYPVMADSALVRQDPHELWRWKCPSCALDRPVTGSHLRAWMDLIDSVGGAWTSQRCLGSTLDIEWSWTV